MYRSYYIFSYATCIRGIIIKRYLAALLSGLLFGLGLAISEMINPKKVLGFLDVAGSWDPSLMFVLGGGLFVTIVAFPLITRMAKPVLDVDFRLPTRTAIDIKLIGGATLFGIGWGLVGYCPGPAIASLAYGQIESWIFIGAMVLGLYADRLYRRPTTVI